MRNLRSSSKARPSLLRSKHTRTSGRPLVVQMVTVPQSTAFLAGQPSYLRKRGFDVVCVSSPGPQLEAFARAERIEAIRIPMERRISPWKDLRSLVRLILLFRRLRPSVVHTHTPKASLLGMLAAWLTGVPVRIFHVHGLPVETATGVQRRILMATDRLSARVANRVLFVSQSLRSLALELGMTEAEKTAVLAGGSANGIDAEGRFSPALWGSQQSVLRRQNGISPDDLVVGFVGRLVQDKGVLDLLEAWQVLRGSGRRLLLVGPVEDADALPASAIDEIERSEDITWVSWTETPEALLSTMDVLCLPSYREGLPLSLLEASAMKLPIVATDIPGNRNAVVDGVTGTLVPPRSPGLLGGALEAYLRAPELRKSHGEAGRAHVLSAFRPEEIWNALANEYASLTGVGAPRETERM